MEGCHLSEDRPVVGRCWGLGGGEASHYYGQLATATSRTHTSVTQCDLSPNTTCWYLLISPGQLIYPLTNLVRSTFLDSHSDFFFYGCFWSEYNLWIYLSTVLVILQPADKFFRFANFFCFPFQVGRLFNIHHTIKCLWWWYCRYQSYPVSSLQSVY